MKLFIPAGLVLLIILMQGCKGQKPVSSHFELITKDLTIELKEDSLPVLIYQKKPKTLTGEYICNNYIHPLFNLVGETYTDEFPADHPYHRGIFWAWHQIYAGGERLGDGWTNDSLQQEVVKVTTEADDNRAVFRSEVNWSSLVLGSSRPFMKEDNEITVQRLANGIRKIDFVIRLRALADDLKIGGSADKKGYGGFCIRFAEPDSMLFTSVNGPVSPQELQLTTGPWMDFTGKFGLVPIVSGVTILVHPDNPGSHDQWILRQKKSMQNAVFPGSGLVDVPRNRPLVLKYRLIIHNGDAGSLNIPELLAEYSK